MHAHPPSPSAVAAPLCPHAFAGATLVLRNSPEIDSGSDDGAPGRPAPDFVPAGKPVGQAAPRIVIVGGGAGGLELAARLGNSAGRRGAAEVVLIDQSMTHLWKPLLHELAAGTLGHEENELDYLQQARAHHFRFHLGRMEALDRSRKQVWLAPMIDDEGVSIAPRRPISYDILVLAVGSRNNDFGTPGVREFALSLDTADDAEHFHRRLLTYCARAELTTGEPIRIVIVGGGATGVELAAELTEAVAEIASYGAALRQLRKPVRICLVEAGPRLLGGLPAALATKVHAELRQRGVEIYTGKRVIEVRRNAVVLATGEELRAEMTVWAAGIRGPEFLADLDELETTRLRQLVVRPTLQTTFDDDIFAIGDCASCVLEAGGKPVPPKAQAAHQQAKLLARSLQLRLQGKPPLPFVYRERGALITLGPERAVGTVSERIAGHRLTFGGLFARLSYQALYRRHLSVLLGTIRTVLVTIGGWLSRRSQPRVKLH